MSSTNVTVIAVTDRMGINDPAGNAVPFNPNGLNLVFLPADLEISVPAGFSFTPTGEKITEGTSTKTDAEAKIIHDTVSPFLQLPAGAELLSVSNGTIEPLPEGTRLNSTDGTPITVPRNTKLKAIR